MVYCIPYLLNFIAVFTLWYKNLSICVYVILHLCYLYYWVVANVHVYRVHTKLYLVKQTNVLYNFVYIQGRIDNGIQ